MRRLLALALTAVTGCGAGWWLLAGPTGAGGSPAVAATDSVVVAALPREFPRAGPAVPPAPAALLPVPLGAAAPAPPAAEAPAPEAAPTAPTHVPGREDEPVWLLVPGLGISAPVAAVGLDRAGELDVPDDPLTVGWWADGALLPAVPQVLVGHVDGRARPGVFASLDRVRVGDPVTVSTAMARTWPTVSPPRARSRRPPSRPTRCTGRGTSRRCN